MSGLTSVESVTSASLREMWSTVEVCSRMLWEDLVAISLMPLPPGLYYLLEELELFFFSHVYVCHLSA